MEELAQDFAAALHDPAPEHVALVIARVAYPDLDPRPYLAQLDDMAAVVAQRIAHAAPGASRANAFLDALRSDLGFRGNEADYYAAENSFLNVVLERRTGLPILLSVVCMALGRRVGASVEGIGFPGHFMARYADAAGEYLLDPFHGAVTPVESAGAYLEGVFGRVILLPPEAFDPVTPVALALRMLNNLRNVYMGEGNARAAAQVLQLMLVAAPESALLWQEHGLLAYRMQDNAVAARSLRRYFFLNGQLTHTFAGLRGSVPDEAPTPDATLSQSDRRMLAILQEIEADRGRYN